VARRRDDALPEREGHDVGRRDAALAEAEQNVPILQATYEAAKEGSAKAQAQLSLAEEKALRNARLRAGNALSQEDYDESLRHRDVSRGSLAEAQAGEKKAKLTYEAKAPSGENVTVAQFKAQLAKARYDLDQCLIVAPAEGRVVNLQLQEGSFMSIATPMLDFIPDGDNYVIASIQENFLRYVQPGQEAEVVLAYYPGRTLKGRVDRVVKITGEGQISSSGTNLPEVAKEVKTGGRFAVAIRLDESNGSLDLPVGAGGSAAARGDDPGRCRRDL